MSTPDLDTIVAFTLARLDEEERDARAAGGAPSDPWEAAPIPNHPDRLPTQVIYRDPILGQRRTVAHVYREGAAEHITRQGPAATLARVEALRALVSWATGEHAEGCCQQAWGAADAARADALRRVASIWRLRPDGAVHPEWREAWAA